MKAAAFAIAALVLSCDNVCAAPAGQTDRAQIITLEHRWLDAIRHHDRGALEQILAAGFTDTNAEGRVRGRDEAIAHASAPADTTQAIAQLKVRVYGDTAIATGINKVRSTAKGWTVEIAFTDVFVRTDGRWRAMCAQETLRKSGAG